MLIAQNEFFEGLDFIPETFEYEYGTRTCYKGADGGYYRIDHFKNVYVIEYAESREAASSNDFEDTNLYDDFITKDELIKTIQSDLINFVVA